MTVKYRFLSTLFIFLLCLTSGYAFAGLDLPDETNDVDIISSDDDKADFLPLDNEPTHPPLRLTPDKSEIVRLDKRATTVVVGNPAHINVLVDTTKTLIVVPRAPGATHFLALDEQQNVIMQRHVIVAAPTKQYIRLRRNCAGDINCQPTSVYYCPDMCHEIAPVDGGTGGQSAEAAAQALTEDSAENSEEANSEPIPAEQLP